MVLEKECKKQNTGMIIMKIVDSVVENLTRERWIPIDSVKSENYFENYCYKIRDIGHIESHKSNPAYLIGSCYLKPGWSYPNQMRSVWHMDSYIEKMLLLNSISQTITNKKEKASKQTKRKKKIKIKPILRLT